MLFGLHLPHKGKEVTKEVLTLSISLRTYSIMAMKLYIGGLAWATTDETLKAYFSQLGEVASARIVMERDTGRSRGFGFVEYADDAAGHEAIAKLNGTELDGRAISVSEARPEGERPARSFAPRGGQGGGYQGGHGNDRGGYQNNY